MKKIAIVTCAGLVVLLFGVVIVLQKKTTLYVENEIEHIAPDSLKVPNMPVLKFKKTRYDFGTAKKDTPITVRFEFRNEGDATLVIYKVDVSCGCLSPDFPKQPVRPDEKGTVEVRIDTKGITGVFNKTLFVRSNATEDVILLRIVGQIK